ncbi:hypothetical protein [Halosimplex salinum]|uniref:hypothetical protein n=1 Tax=Halosimplex salinum TaxID=1710538 RepID=UPI000F46398F|nr:hypothetical protein [Halosimplex salinum]
MNVDADEFIDERPAAATAVVAAVATAAYAGIQLVLDGEVALAETAAFVLIFTLVYVGGNRYLQSRGADGDSGDSGDGTADAVDPADE